MALIWRITFPRRIATRSIAARSLMPSAVPIDRKGRSTSGTPRWRISSRPRETVSSDEDMAHLPFFFDCHERTCQMATAHRAALAQLIQGVFDHGIRILLVAAGTRSDDRWQTAAAADGGTEFNQSPKLVRVRPDRRVTISIQRRDHR